MRESSKAALSGIIAALSVVIMLITYLSPILVYTAPPLAGILLIVIIKEISYKWATSTYFAISILALLFIADKESAVFFTFFFGYYPILHSLIHSKLRNLPLICLLKFGVFNVALLSAVCVSTFVFNIDYSDFDLTSKAFAVLFWGMMNLIFVLYDIVLKRLNEVYDKKLKKFFARTFHH